MIQIMSHMTVILLKYITLLCLSRIIKVTAATWVWLSPLARRCIILSLLCEKLESELLFCLFNKKRTPQCSPAVLAWSLISLKIINASVRTWLMDTVINDDVIQIPIMQPSLMDRTVYKNEAWSFKSIAMETVWRGERKQMSVCARERERERGGASEWAYP